MVGLSRIAAILAAQVGFLSAPIGLATAVRADALPTMSIGKLKSAYLECERAAAEGDLESGRIEECSTTYEELKRRAFDNDFRRLKVWYDIEIAAGDSGRGKRHGDGQAEAGSRP